MPAEFPGAIPTINAGLVDGVDAGDDTPGSMNVGSHATHHNKLAQEVVAIATALGPSLGNIPAARSSVFALSGAVAAGEIVAPLGQAPPPGFASRATAVAVGIGSTSCEIRRVTGVSGSNLTLDRAFAYAHSSGDLVLWLVGGAATPAMFGAVGNAIGGSETDDEPSVQAAINECQAADVWLDGMNCRYILKTGLVFPQSAKIRGVQKFKAKTDYIGTGADDWMGQTCQDTPQTFTVNTGTDTFTTPNDHGIGGVGNKVVFKGANLPAPLVAGRWYYVKTIPTTKTLTISATSGGATLDITTAGSGAMKLYPDVVALEKVYMNDVRWDGANIAQNGFMGALQQPHEGFKNYFEHFLGTGVKLSGQQFSLWNLIIVGCGTGLVLGDSLTACFEGYFYGVNVEQCTVAGIIPRNVHFSAIWGLHCEVSPIHVHFPSDASARNFAIDTGILPVSGSMVGVKCETDQVGYELRNCAPYGGAGSDVYINDTARGFTITKDDIGDFNSTETSFAQPFGQYSPFSRYRRVLSKSANYTAKMLDDVILVDASGAARTITLPAAALKGKKITVKKIDASANAVTVDANAAETIDGALTKALAAQYDKITLVADGTGQQII